MKPFSRRSVLLSAAVIPTSTVFKQTPAADNVLFALGREFDTFTEKIDSGLNIPWEALNEFSRVEEQIVATPATTMEGLCVKARAACWALLGDLDSNEQSTTNERMALSIVRDLIRLYNPSLERPGALRRLVTEIEQEAEKRPPFLAA
ncbi:MAG TPA: hypothetical protein VIY48_03090 [Candidatus Paceibacterota bacterium]